MLNNLYKNDPPIRSLLMATLRLLLILSINKALFQDALGQGHVLSSLTNESATESSSDAMAPSRSRGSALPSSNSDEKCASRLKEILAKAVIGVTSKLPNDRSLNLADLPRRLSSSLEAQLREFAKESPQSQIVAGSDFISWDTDCSVNPEEVVFKARITADNRRILQIQAEFPSEVETDGLLIIFAPDPINKKWIELFRWSGLPSSSGLNHTEYVISPMDQRGKWYLLGFDIRAQESSCWGTLNFYALRPQNGSIKPMILLQRSVPFYRCVDGEWDLDLNAMPSHFSIRYPGDSLLTDELIRQHLVYYSFKQERLSRAMPFTNNILHFIEEWITAPWNEASSWCTSKDCTTNNRKNLQSVHQEINQRLTAGSMIKLQSIHHSLRPATTIIKIRLESPTQAPSFFDLAAKKAKNGFVLFDGGVPALP